MSLPEVEGRAKRGAGDVAADLPRLVDHVALARYPVGVGAESRFAGSAGGMPAVAGASLQDGELLRRLIYMTPAADHRGDASPAMIETSSKDTEAK
jgi:hypothetical protein